MSREDEGRPLDFFADPSPTGRLCSGSLSPLTRFCFSATLSPSSCRFLLTFSSDACTWDVLLAASLSARAKHTTDMLAAASSRTPRDTSRNASAVPPVSGTSSVNASLTLATSHSMSGC